MHATPKGIAELAAFCRKHQVGFVAMEATGEYERLPFGLFWATGVPAVIVNLRAVRRFAEAMRIWKADRIGTGVIAWFAEVKPVGLPPIAAKAASATATLHARRQPDDPFRRRRHGPRLRPRLADAHHPPDRSWQAEKLIRTAFAPKLLVRLNAKACTPRHEFANPLDKSNGCSPSHRKTCPRGRSAWTRARGPSSPPASGRRGEGHQWDKASARICALAVFAGWR